MLTVKYLLRFNILRQLKISSKEDSVSLSNMSNIRDLNEIELLQQAKSNIFNLDEHLHKGAAGRIGVIGGSLEYTGAPYYAAISSLRVGADLSHVICCEKAAPVIKSYSPELIVHPLLDIKNAIEEIKPWIPRLHTLVIGPGLGREEKTLDTVAKIIQVCKGPDPAYRKPLVIDADGLFLVTEKPDLIINYPSPIILTPNAVEFVRLARSVLNENWQASSVPNPQRVVALAKALGPNAVVLHKGVADIIAEGKNGEFWTCSDGGSPRRCGGQGDLLSGSLGTFLHWSQEAPSGKIMPSVVAAYSSAKLTRECNSKAFKKLGRNMLTTDMILCIHSAFEELFN